MRTGLVLEGGAMRGLYTAGVLDIFNENDIIFDGVMGVSAGIIHAINYVSLQPGRSIRYTLKYRKNKRFMSVRSFLKTGSLVEKDFCYHLIPDELDPFDYETYRNSKIDTYAVCSNVETGRAEYIKCTDLEKQMDIVRASASMPFVSEIVNSQGMKLLDGGVCDSIPVRKMFDMGYDRIVVVLTKMRDYVAKPASPVLSKKMYHDYPKFVDSLITMHLQYMDCFKYVCRLEDNKEILVIRPSKFVDMTRTEKNLSRLWDIYDLGREDAKKKLDEVKLWLEKQ